MQPLAGPGLLSAQIPLTQPDARLALITCTRFPPTDSALERRRNVCLVAPRPILSLDSERKWLPCSNASPRHQDKMRFPHGIISRSTRAPRLHPTYNKHVQLKKEKKECPATLIAMAAVAAMPNTTTSAPSTARLVSIAPFHSEAPRLTRSSGCVSALPSMQRAEHRRQQLLSRSHLRSPELREPARQRS